MWKEIRINKQNLKSDTEKALLFNCLHNSDYDSYSFWYPKKLTKQIKGSYYLRVCDEMFIELKKYGKGKRNQFTVMESRQITGDELISMFGDDEESYLIVEEPEVYEKNVQVLDEFKNSTAN